MINRGADDTVRQSCVRDSFPPLPARPVRRRFALMKRLALIAAAAVSLAACAEEPMGPIGPTASVPAAAGSANVFRDEDFGWSTAGGSGSIAGTLGFRTNSARYSCQGGDVILLPETAWTRRRMVILYGSPAAAAVPLDIVRARTPSAPSGNYARYAKRTTCDAENHFGFTGLPDGPWFVITIAKPVDGAGDPFAVMRRVETRGGQKFVSLN